MMKRITAGHIPKIRMSQVHSHHLVRQSLSEVYSEFIIMVSYGLRSKCTTQRLKENYCVD